MKPVQGTGGLCCSVPCGLKTVTRSHFSKEGVSISSPVFFMMQCFDYGISTAIQQEVSIWHGLLLNYISASGITVFGCG
jgi:hypothetical protein